MGGSVTDVAAAAAIAPGRSAAFVIEGQSIAVFNHDGQYFAVENRCPHQGAPLAGAPILKGGRVRCMLHGWLFKLEGREEDDEIKRYPVTVENGKLLVASEPYPVDQFP